MRAVDLTLVERFERLTFLQIVECGVYTVISAGINIILSKVLDLPPDLLSLCAIWLFNCLLGVKMGYASDQDPMSFSVVGAASFVAAMAMYLILQPVVP